MQKSIQLLPQKTNIPSQFQNPRINTGFVSVWLFHFLSGSFQAVYMKSMYSGPTIPCVNRVECWCYLSQTCIHAILGMHLHYCIVVNCEWKIVKLNPGPMKKCPKCEKLMPARSKNCRCGHLLCFVAKRVLHFSAFIFVCTCIFQSLSKASTCLFLPNFAKFW